MPDEEELPPDLVEADEIGRRLAAVVEKTCLRCFGLKDVDCICVKEIETETEGDAIS